MDLARIGFVADTSDLKDAKASLEALVPAAKRAENAAKGVTRAAAGLAGGIKPFSNAVQQAATGSTGLSRAALASSTAMGTVQRAAVGASTQLGTLGGSVRRVGMNFAQADAHVEAYKRSLAGVAPAAESARSSLQRMGAAANDNINAMQATPGNIAAQFQDIGVTAAAGMNPMIIALQQGTQLSAAMSGGVGNLVRGLGQLFNATTLLTIGLVGLLAAGIQMVDWAEAGAWALNTLADAMVPIAPYAVGIAGALALIYSPAIVAGIWSLSKAFYGLAAGMLATIGIPALIVLGLAAIIAAANVWRDELTQMLGFDIVAAAKTGVNAVIAFFVGGYNAIAATWRQLPGAMGDWAIQATNAVISAIESMINGAITRINAFVSMLPFGDKLVGRMGGLADFGRVANPFAGQGNAVGREWKAQTQGALGTDFVGGAVDAITGAASTAADWLRGLAGDLTAAEEGKGGKSKTGRTARGRHQKTNDELFAEVIEGADKQMRALQDASAQIGVYGEALERLKFEQQLFNDAQDKGVVLTAAMSEELKRRAAEMASLAQGNVRDQFMEDMRKDHEDAMAALARERGEIGLTGEALEAYRIETDMLNQARRAGLALTEPELAALRRYAIEQAAAGAAIDRTREAYERLQEITTEVHNAQRGMIEDFITGIRKGESVLDSFLNAMENFANRLLDLGLDAILDSLFTAPNGQSRGLLGGVLGTFVSGIAGSLSPGAGAGVGSAIGGGAHGGNILMAANGAAFTNGIFTEPTMFKFAKGAALGMMGEAGPEAVMPLKRGPDGSLGVQSHGGGGTVVNAPVEVNNHYSIQGAVSSADIIGMVRSGSEQTKRDLARQLPALLAQLQRDGTIN